VPPQNIVAAVDTVDELGRYPLAGSPDERDALAERLAAANYWPKPLEALSTVEIDSASN